MLLYYYIILKPLIFKSMQSLRLHYTCSFVLAEPCKVKTTA